MRRAAVTHIDLNDLDLEKRLIPTLEKGQIKHPYPISKEGAEAIDQYIEEERSSDDERWQSSILFLSARITANGQGQLSSKAINRIWQDVCALAGVQESCILPEATCLIDRTGFGSGTTVNVATSLATSFEPRQVRTKMFLPSALSGAAGMM